MALAVIPCRPHSRAAVRVSAAMPALAALYSPRPASPRSAASETMLMTRPQPRAAMCGRAAHIAHHVPFTPLVHDRSNCSSGMSSSGARAPNPCALLTSTSTLPQRRTVSRSEEHTSELQSRLHLVCRLLPEKKNARQHRVGAHDLRSAVAHE